MKDMTDGVPVSRLSSADGRRAPSGGQVVLSFGDQVATVVEVGGALRSYASGDRPLLDGYGVHERCTGARGQSLIPWPNRLRDGTYRFGDHDHQLALTEPAKRNAIHGLVRWANWSVAERTDDGVSMAHTLHPRPGWPFLLDLHIDYRLAAEGLSVRTTATNAGADACPYGAGSHPYLTVGTETIDRLSLRAPGTRRMITDDQAIPVRTERVDGTEYDFRAARLIGPTVLDTGFTDLVRDRAGLAQVELVEPESQARVRLWMDDSYRYLMLFTGDSLADASRRRRGLGVEPMTCAPNALQSGEGLRTLEPGESSTSEWGISAQSGAGSGE